jgi:hypothetical protein
VFTLSIEYHPLLALKAKNIRGKETEEKGGNAV